MALDLVVPHLRPAADAPPELRDVRLPALEKWLGRASLERLPARNLFEWLAEAFELAAPAPIAAVSRLAEGRDAQGAWLHADPVHLRIDRDTLTLHPAAALAIAQEEADAMLATIQAHFRADGLVFDASSPERWYVRVPAGEVPATTPLDDALNQDVRKLLPTSPGDLNWASALTEAQMLLAAHEVNLGREASGRPAINSLWLWGGGPLPASVASSYSAIHSDEPFSRGLAMLAGSPPRDLPENLLALSREAKHTLAVLDALTHGVRAADRERWNADAKRLDDRWFAEIPAAVRRFGSVRLILPGPFDTLVATIASATPWHWPRPAKPLSAYA